LHAIGALAAFLYPSDLHSVGSAGLGKWEITACHTQAKDAAPRSCRADFNSTTLSTSGGLLLRLVFRLPRGTNHNGKFHLAMSRAKEVYLD
jgi:hypothetical protein